MRSFLRGGGVVIVVGVLCTSACGGSESSNDGADTGSTTDEDSGSSASDSATSTDSNVTTTDSGSGDDTARVDAAPDHGTPSDKFPAFPPDLPQLVNNGGPVLTNPVVVTVTYSDDPKAATYEAFGDALGASDYWKAVTSEYGVGPVTSGAANHVRIPGTPPATMSGRDFRTLVQTNAGGSWPAPTDGTIYVIYASPSTTVSGFGGSDICSTGVAGYHQSTTAAGAAVAFAVLPACKGTGTRTDTASHEIAEAATDPFGSSPAFVNFDDVHLAWDLWFDFSPDTPWEVEDGDACELFVDSFYTETESGFAYAVQRQWSNAAAAAGKNPCVPATSGPYYNVAPLALEDVTVDLSSIGGPTAQRTKGYHVAVGETKTFSVGLWSEAARAPWSLRVVEGNPSLGPVTPAHVTATLDTKGGQNGQTANVTVTVKSVGDYGVELLSIESFEFGGSQHYMPVIIASK